MDLLSQGVLSRDLAGEGNLGIAHHLLHVQVAGLHPGHGRGALHAGAEAVAVQTVDMEFGVQAQRIGLLEHFQAAFPLVVSAHSDEHVGQVGVLRFERAA